MNEMFSQGGKGSTGILTNKQAIARYFGVKQSEIVYFSVGVDISGYKVIYDKVTQRAYSLPIGIPMGTTAISLSTAAVLVHSAGSIDLGALAVTREEYVTLPGSFDSGVTLNVKNELLTYTDGKYRWNGALPKTVAAGSTPATTGGVGIGAWVSVGDVSLRNQLISDQGGDLATTKLPIENSIKRTINDRNSDIISLKDFVYADDPVDDYSPAISRLLPYLETLSTIKFVGTGNDCGGLIIDAPGIIRVSNTIEFKNTRNLTLRGWNVRPHPTFTRGDYLMRFTSNVVDQYAHENLTLESVTLDGEFEANCLNLQDFLRVKMSNCAIYRYFEYGVRTENINNGSHELMITNADFFQSFDGSYPSHITSGISLQNENNDNHLNNSVLGPVFTNPVVCTDYVTAVKSGGGAFFVSNVHSYGARKIWKIDAAGVYINNSYFDGDLIVNSKRKFSLNNCFLQVTGSTGNVNFITPTGDVGEWNIKDCNFVNRDNAPNVRMMPDITGKSVYESFISDNAGTNVTKVRVYESDTQSQVFTPANWNVTADGTYVETSFPAYKGNKQITVIAESVNDRTKFFTVVRIGTVARIYCWFIDGAGKATPTGNVTVYASGQTPPDVAGTV